MEHPRRGRPHDVFICYSKATIGESVDRPAHLQEVLRARGIEAFVYETSLKHGGPWEEQALAALRQVRCVLVLVPDDAALSDYVNHEIGLAHAYGKRLLPVFMGTGFPEEVSSANLLRSIWAIGWQRLLESLGDFISQNKLANGARLRRFWSRYWDFRNVLVVHGGFNPGAATGTSVGTAADIKPGEHLSLGDLNALIAFSSFIRREFGVELPPSKIRYAGDMSLPELKGKDLLIVGGPAAFAGTALKDLHESNSISYVKEERVFEVGSDRQRTCADKGDRRVGIVVPVTHPSDRNRSATVFCGHTGYGAQTAMTYAVSEMIEDAVVEAAEGWTTESGRHTFVEVAAPFRKTMQEDGSFETRVHDCQADANPVN